MKRNNEPSPKKVHIPPSKESFLTRTIRSFFDIAKTAYNNPAWFFGLKRQTPNQLFEDAFQQNNTWLLQYAISQGANIHRSPGYYNDNIKLPSAAGKGYTDIVRVLIENNVNIQTTDASGFTPLHMAVIGGHTDIVRLLLENGADIEAEDIVGFKPLHRAALYGHTAMARLLIENGANKFSRKNNNETPLFMCSKFAHVGSNAETVSYLLSLPDFQPITRFGAELATNNNALLLKSVETNHIALVNQLLTCEEVIAIIAVNDNAIIRAAISHRHTAIEARLRQVPALTNFRIRTTTTADRSLADIAASKESSMAALTRSEQSLLDILRQKYLNRVQLNTTTFWLWEWFGFRSTLDSMRDYLANKYNNAPAIDENKQPLPLIIRANSSSLTAYYQHPLHTAWRYCHYLQKPHNMSITEKETLACLWLAVQEEKCDPDALIRELAYLGRAHNWDGYRLNTVTGKQEQFDDLKQDNPSCPGGIQKRLLTPIQLLPTMQQYHLLSPNTLKARFKEKIIAENKNTGFNLYRQLEALEVNTLQDIQSAMSSLFMPGGRLNKDEKKALSHLHISERVMDSFILECVQYFSPFWENDRKEKVAVVVGKDKFDNYPTYVKTLASNIVLHFGDEINTIIGAMIEKKNIATPAMNYLPSQAVNEPVNNNKVKHICKKRKIPLN